MAQQAAQWQQQLKGSKPLPTWLSDLRRLLQGTGQWTLLNAAENAVVISTINAVKISPRIG